ncbi:hypothetical protein ACFLUY_02635 [Chloroflexota bacterium]
MSDRASADDCLLTSVCVSLLCKLVGFGVLSAGVGRTIPASELVFVTAGTVLEPLFTNGR